MDCIANFFAGAFLCNCIPHLCSGLEGRVFPTPFAKPSGIGDSPALVNLLWGFFNFVAGIALLARYPVAVGFHSGFITAIAGALVIGIFCSLHFGKVQRRKLRP